MLPTFLAIDFETANDSPSSVCAIGLVRVERGEFVRRVHDWLLPETRSFERAHMNGLTWEDCANGPTFAELWPTISGLFDRIDFIAAHGAAADQSILRLCCHRADVPMPKVPFVCTERLSRGTWGFYLPKRRPRGPDKPLRPRDVSSSAAASARIVLRAFESSASQLVA